MQVPQEEVGHRILEDGSVEKTVRIRSLCKVEWYEDSNCDIVVPVSISAELIYLNILEIMFRITGYHFIHGFA